MKITKLALTFVKVFYEDWDPKKLRELLADELQFSGPFAKYQSASEYLAALRKDPPLGMHYQITDIFENENSVCMVYRFSKGTMECPMCQIFEFDSQNKINKIRLIFDTGQFER